MGQHSITYGDMVPTTMLRFTVVFEDGDRVPGACHPNPEDSDETIIAHCNNGGVPAHWGRVVAIEDREVIPAYILK